MVFKKIIFQNRYVALETPPLHGKCHLKFPFWLSAHFPYANQPIPSGGDKSESWLGCSGQKSNWSFGSQQVKFIMFSWAGSANLAIGVIFRAQHAAYCSTSMLHQKTCRSNEAIRHIPSAIGSTLCLYQRNRYSTILAGKKYSIFWMGLQKLDSFETSYNFFGSNIHHYWAAYPVPFIQLRGCS